MNAEQNLPEGCIAENLEHVRKNVRAACARTGRDPGEVTLVAVSKLKPCSAISEAYKAKARDFGENYVQELREKQEFFETNVLPEPIRWHMIGHLQKNKVKYLIGQTALIHSVDSMELAEKIDAEAAKKGASADILLEVNVAEEPQKWGFKAAETLAAAREAAKLSHVRLLGLMTSAPYTADPETNRPFFRTLNTLAKTLEEEGLIRTSAEFRTPILSMGMSNDYEIAVEEGATMVRIGTDIFGARDYNNNLGGQQ